MTDKKPARVVTIKNALKEKVGDGGFNAEDIERAQHAIENTEIDFAPQGKELLDRLQNTMDDIRSGKMKNDRSCMMELTFPLLQLKAQGGMLNYPSISQVTVDLMMFLDDIEVVDEDILKILTSYHRSATAILDMELRHTTNDIVIQLTKEMKAVCDRYAKKQAVKPTP